LRDQPLVRARLLRTVGTSYRNLGEVAKSAPLLTEALDLLRGPGGLPADHPDVVEAEFALAQLELDTGDAFAAETRFRRVLDHQQRAGVGEKKLSVTRIFLAGALAIQEKPEAEPLGRAEIALRDRLFGRNDPQTALVRLGLAGFLLNQRKVKEPLALLAEVNAALEAHPDTQLRVLAAVLIEAQTGIGARFAAMELPQALRPTVLRKAERHLSEGIRKAGEVLPAGKNIYVALLRFNLGCVYRDLKDPKRAETEFRVALETARDTCGLSHPTVRHLLAEYPKLLGEAGRLDEARAVFDEVLAANERRLGADNYWRTSLLLEQAYFEAATAKDPGRAMPLVREVLAKGKLAPVQRTADRLSGLIIFLPFQQDPRLAEDLYAAARPIIAAVHGEVSVEAHDAALLHAVALFLARKWAAADELLRDAERIAARLGNMQATVWTSTRVQARGWLDAARGRFAEAEAAYRAVLAEWRTDSLDRSNVLADLTGVLADQGKMTAAAEAAAEGYRHLLRTNPNPVSLAVSVTNLGETRFAAGDPDGAVAALDGPTRQLARTDDPKVLTYLVRAWAFAPAERISPGAAELADRLRGICERHYALSESDRSPTLWGRVTTAALRPPPDLTGADRALAQFYVRTGNTAAAAEALRRVGKPQRPADHLLLGLIAARTGKPEEARQQMAEADRLTRARAPSPENPYPYAYANEHWLSRVLARSLRSDLECELDPHLAPPPRPITRGDP
jgi:tetratricopeptide (TPR) repeat protein